MGSWEDALKQTFEALKVPDGAEPMPGKLFIDPKLAPAVKGASRPLAPGEYLKNPSGSWSSEVSVTVQDPRLNDGKPTIIPSMWLIGGKSYKLPEDGAVDHALGSGLQFPSFDSIPAAEDFANKRESVWQGVEPSKAAAIPPLWMTAPRRAK